MEKVVDYIIEHSLIQKDDRVGVAVSGGADSMALLHFLESIHKQAGFEIIAIHINHSIRPESKQESQFVNKFCRELGIECITMIVDVPTYSKKHRLGTEQAARVLRYDAFEKVVKKKGLNKVALGHHINDQAETILMHIFRGSGASGAIGMSPQRGFYIRPMLEVSRTEIISYNHNLRINFVDDPSNKDDTYSRNFVRNQIMPLLEREWRGVQKNITDFGKNAKKDEDYINSLIDQNTFIISENVIRIPLSLFQYHDAVVNRILMHAFGQITTRENIERKHIKLVTALARDGANGSRSDLPNQMFAVREYEYLAIVRRQTAATTRVFSFKIGKTTFPDFGTVNVTKTISFKDAIKNEKVLVMDVDLVPKGAKWRTRRDGDTFTKFGGGTKPLNAYLIDQKVPKRMRDNLPVLAHGNEILAIAGMEISNNVRIGPRTLEAYIVQDAKEA